MLKLVLVKERSIQELEAKTQTSEFELRNPHLVQKYQELITESNF